MIKTIHPLAGALALLTIAAFWPSTAFAELFASEATVIIVKTAIPWSFLALIPALMVAGGSGLYAGGKAAWRYHRYEDQAHAADCSQRHFDPDPLGAIPRTKVSAGEFDTGFYVAQAIELAAGAANIALLGLNMRDGLKMKGRLRRKPA